jgi:hypothetical protein
LRHHLFRDIAVERLADKLTPPGEGFPLLLQVGFDGVAVVGGQLQYGFQIIALLLQGFREAIGMVGGHL